MRKTILGATAAFALAITAASTSQAAFINIDDTDPDTITITAGDFEFGFSVNGTPLASGGSLVLPDGVAHTFSGTWITDGSSDTLSILFTEDGLPGPATSGINGTKVGDTINGSFFGYSPGLTFGVATAPFAQGTTGTDGVAFLSSIFISEAVGPIGVPEPAGLAILVAGLAGLGLARRRRAA